MTFEKSVRLQIVEYGRHIAFPVAPAAYLSGIGFQDTPISGDENAKHLALRDFVMPLGMRLNIGKNVVYVRFKVYSLKFRVER